MRVRTHLVAMPWSPPDTPSIQVACLKAHLDRTRGRGADCRAYSAFFSILHRVAGGSSRELFRETSFYGEYVYQALYLRRFGPPELRGEAAFRGLLRALRGPSSAALPAAAVDGLERATRAYLDEELAPALVAGGVNLVGFTLNYDQVYASLYAAEHLRRRHPDRRLLFVYGGSSATSPDVVRLMVNLGVPGLVVAGEGERKLELLVRALEALPTPRAARAADAVSGLDPGIVRIGEPVDFGVHDPARHARQLEDLRELAPPDYREYFAALRRACADERTYAAYRASTELFVEGSRGCFGRCDFCAMNRTWSGFRSRDAGEVLRAAQSLARAHGSSNLVFADNVCDAWAGAYARALVQQGVRLRALMELRASHAERFWTQLALTGVKCVQVGVEALARPLLEAMGKGTRVIDNLAAQKVLTELGVWSSNQLITHHPASTLGDVRETWRIVRQIPHWSALRPVKFQLVAGSRIYQRLSREEREALRPSRSFALPRGAARYACELSYEVPRSMGPAPAVARAWSAFTRWCERAAAHHRALRPRLEVVAVAPGTLRVTDARDGGVRVHELSGEAARVYDACHAGATIDEVARQAGLSPGDAQALLARLLRSRLVLRADGHWIALATRPRDELLRRFLLPDAAATPASARAGGDPRPLEPSTCASAPT